MKIKAILQNEKKEVVYIIAVDMNFVYYVKNTGEIGYCKHCKIKVSDPTYLV
ncbi:MAG: hypothetical protein IJX81_01175 [Clostridia bacterium]|nr:hypothetical protein [Clostridia bacterium]